MAGTQISTGDRFNKIAKYLNDARAQSQIARVCSKLVSADELARVTLTAVQRNPLLLECTPESLCMELMRLGEMGLKPNGYEAHLVPFKEYDGGGNVKRVNVTAIVDWKGYVKLMYRSGLIVSIGAAAVRAKDKFSYRYGFGAYLEHEPFDSDTLEGRGPLKAAWALAQLKDGGSPFVVLSRAEVAQRKAASRGSKGASSPWVKYEDQMWAKSAVRQLAKFVPLSPEIERAVESDDKAEFGEEFIDVPASAAAALEDHSEDHDTVDVTPPPQSRTQRLADRAADAKRATSTKPVTKTTIRKPEPEPEPEPEQDEELADEPSDEGVDEPGPDEESQEVPREEDHRDRRSILADFEEHLYACADDDELDAYLEHNITFNQEKLKASDRSWAKNLVETRKNELRDAQERGKKGAKR